MKLMVFLHGTAIMHPAARGIPRTERVQQVREGEPSVRDFRNYVPAEAAVEKLRRWAEQGADVVYLSSHRKPAHVAADEEVLARHGFPKGRVLCRQGSQSYGDVVSRELPDILIEDDCESIGASELAYPQISPQLRSRIKSIVVPEFGGFAHLPGDLGELSPRHTGAS
jgi:hypothetical protein